MTRAPHTQPLPVERIDSIVDEAKALLEALKTQPREAIIRNGLENLTATRFARWIVEAATHPRPDARALEVVSGLATAVDGYIANMKMRAETGMSCTAEIEDDGTLCHPVGNSQVRDLYDALATARQYINEMKG